MNRQPWQNVSHVRVLNGLCIAGLSMSLTLAAISPAQAGIIERIRAIFQPNRELKSATGTRRGGGSRDICEVPMSNEGSPIGTAASTNASSLDGMATAEAVSPNSLVAFSPGEIVVDPESGEQEFLVEGKTLDAYPSFSVYVPFSKAEHSANLEFAISNPDTLEYVAGPFELELPDTPGLVTLQMTDAQLAEADGQPEMVQFSGLQPGTVYEWTVTLRCNTDDSSSSLQAVHGLISLVSDSDLLSSEITDYSVYLDHQLWYDMVAQLMLRPDEHPELWTDILTYVGLDSETVDTNVISLSVPPVVVTEP